MKAKYQKIKIRQKIFIVKLDYNEFSGEYTYHMYARHLITPEQAIAAYFNKSYEKYNRIYDRYELYSEKYDVTVYYTYLKDKNVMLITAFSGEI